jgi:hypothetical protein
MNNNNRLTLYSDLREFRIFHPTGKLLREKDIVFRCFLFEVCKTLKEFNIKLVTIEGKEVDVFQVVQKSLPHVFVWSRAGDFLRTELNVKYGLL